MICICWLCSKAIVYFPFNESTPATSSRVNGPGDESSRNIHKQKVGSQSLEIHQYFILTQPEISLDVPRPILRVPH